MCFWYDYSTMFFAEVNPLLLCLFWLLEKRTVKVLLIFTKTVHQKVKVDLYAELYAFDYSLILKM